MDATGQRGVGQRFAPLATTFCDRYTVNIDNTQAVFNDASSPIPGLATEAHRSH